MSSAQRIVRANPTPAAIVGIVLGLLLLLAPAASAAEEETHFFNATLSLTGDCSTNTFDPVPDPSCPGGPPSGAFVDPSAVAVDAYGNRYVGSQGAAADGSEGRIDIFGPSGEFLTEIAVPKVKLIAVDGDGRLYVSRPVESLVRYDPTLYNPAAGEIAYGTPPVGVIGTQGGQPVAVNPANDRLFEPRGNRVREYGSAAEGNVVLDDTIGQGSFDAPLGANTVALDAANKLLYASDYKAGSNPAEPVVRVFDLDPPHLLLGTIDGSPTAAGKFVVEGTHSLLLAAEEATARLFVAELSTGLPRVHEFEADGSYVSRIGRNGMQPMNNAQIAYDNSPTSPTLGHLFVPASAESQPGRSVAFEPKPPEPPVVEGVSVSGVSEVEAVLEAEINPNGAPTDYRFEYVTEQGFEETGTFAGALLAGEGSIPAGGEGVAVSKPAVGLDPGTRYRFRVVAENEFGQDEGAGSFATHRPPDASSACPNSALRTGSSAALPDCRAYELVTPSNTNGRMPQDVQASVGHQFASRPVSPAGDKFSFVIAGGSIPGFDVTGSFQGDPYVATRGPSGWSTESAGPTGLEAANLLPGNFSADQGYSFWRAFPGSAAAIGGKNSDYLRHPDGHSELVGEGSIATDQAVDEFSVFIAEGGSHVIFKTKNTVSHTTVQIEPNAPPDGTQAIYDRTPDGVRHVVSLLPGDLTPAAGQHAQYLGSSFDGEVVAFRVGSNPTDPGPIYLRLDNAETVVAAPADATYAGLAKGGRRLFYLQDGDLYAFDVDTEAVIPFTQSGVVNGSGEGDVTVVNVAAGGTAAYLVSPSLLGNEANPNGQLPLKGAYNLFLSEEGQIRFVARVTERDAKGEDVGDGFFSDGLGLWPDSLLGGRLNKDPSRTTPAGEVLLFESRAKLTEYDPEGEAQVYRYDAAAGTLGCLSCPPTLAGPSGGAHLHSRDSDGNFTSNPRLNLNTLVNNLRADGQRAFFESPDPLVAADTDGRVDVYEWEDQGVGSCRTAGGCVYLISSGKSAEDEYLYGVSDSGDDVFILTSDLLLPAVDPDATRSIYDARVNGGFPPPAAPAGECLGEACQPAAVAPNDPTPASSTFRGAGNVAVQPKGRRCPRGKRAVRRAGKRRCVAKRRARTAKQHRRRANGNGRAKR